MAEVWIFSALLLLSFTMCRIFRPRRSDHEHEAPASLDSTLLCFVGFFNVIQNHKATWHFGGRVKLIDETLGTQSSRNESSF